MPAPRPPEFRRRAVELARPRKEADRPDRQEPGIAGIMPAQLDGPDRRRRGLVRELAAFVMEMTLPAIAVSVIRAVATGLPACGRPAFPEEQHDGRITRWAPPDDVAVQSQAEGRRWVLSASGRRDLAGSRTGFAWLATGPGGGRTSASASGGRRIVGARRVQMPASARSSPVVVAGAGAGGHYQRARADGSAPWCAGRRA